MIDDALIQAMIHIESAGDPYAVSPAGAKGLMQLMDPTGEELWAKLGYPGKYDPFDADKNVEMGRYYIEHLYYKFHDEKLALAAYNWGQGRVKKLIEKLGSNDWEYLSKSWLVPKETRNYVQKVLKKREEILLSESQKEEQVH